MDSTFLFIISVFSNDRVLSSKIVVLFIKNDSEELEQSEKKQNT